jgi:hypothetical protein
VANRYTIPRLRAEEVATKEWNVLEKHKQMTELSLQRISKFQRIQIAEVGKTGRHLNFCS